MDPGPFKIYSWKSIDLAVVEIDYHITWIMCNACLDKSGNNHFSVQAIVQRYMKREIWVSQQHTIKVWFLSHHVDVTAIKRLKKASIFFFYNGTQHDEVGLLFSKSYSFWTFFKVIAATYSYVIKIFLIIQFCCSTSNWCFE